MKVLACGSLVGFGIPLLESCASRSVRAAPHPDPLAIDVAGLEDGQFLVADTTGPDGAPILVVRRSPDQFTVLSLQCTHEGCPVNPPVNGVLTCPCHESRFDLDGNVRRGPAQVPLGRYPWSYDRARKLVVVRFD